MNLIYSKTNIIEGKNRRIFGSFFFIIFDSYLSANLREIFMQANISANNEKFISLKTANFDTKRLAKLYTPGLMTGHTSGRSKTDRRFTEWPRNVYLTTCQDKNIRSNLRSSITRPLSTLKVSEIMMEFIK
ncbi:hypothetical protein BpHYR1_041588 [Brachionus plicatilis]|uniref:Uncharacterized protein n=1 Tax=Brachionus plicatilis TaxID=10195 RepID=A0A3M7SRR2_BRAPC|nr:hypothetical protein BpHYR1_041588 [Brachionus plicatilis]